MRIRIHQAFASNNSGSYTIVGTFGSEEVAREVADVVRDVCGAQDGWWNAQADARAQHSPLALFARQHGLGEEAPGEGEDWPEHGDPASIIAIGHQVLLHAPYTITMPRAFGEYFYQRGGRVSLELDHAHEDLAVEIAFYIPKMNWNDPARGERFDQLERMLEPILEEHSKRREHDRRPSIAPVFYQGDWGNRRLAAVFSDVVAAVGAVRDVAKGLGVEIHVHITECAHGVEDPFGHLRGSLIPRGLSRVILWSAGNDPTAAMKAVRDVTGVSVDKIKEVMSNLPKEILVDVAPSTAAAALVKLKAAGCDAETMIPVRRE